MPDPARKPVELTPRQALQDRVATAILDAAARTFAARGDAANMSDVAVAAGVARATVYRYFPNRLRLVAELTRSAAKDAHDRLLAARIDEVAVEEGIARAVRAFVDVGDSFVVLVRERGGGGAAEFDLLLAPPLRHVLERGRTAGHIREDLPTAWLLEALIGILVSVLRHGSLGRDDAVAAVTTLFLDGVSVRSRVTPLA